MALPVQEQRAATVPNVVVEEKFYELSLSNHEKSLRKAIEHATGMQVEELAPGMWFGTRRVDRWTTLELTARAQAVDDGTTVELRVEHKVSPIASTLWISGLILGSIFILPLVAIVAYSQKRTQAQQRERQVFIHKIWREIAEVIHAPARAGYREAPKRVYVPGAKDLRIAESDAHAGHPAETEPLEAEVEQKSMRSRG